METSNADEDAEKLDHSYIAHRNTEWSRYSGIQFGSFAKIKLNIQLTMWPINHTPGYFSQRNKNFCLHKKYTCMFIVTLLVIAKNCKQTRCLSVGEW